MIATIKIVLIKIENIYHIYGQEKVKRFRTNAMLIQSFQVTEVIRFQERKVKTTQILLSRLKLSRAVLYGHLYLNLSEYLRFLYYTQISFLPALGLASAVVL